jgi:hypothetical protein
LQRHCAAPAHTHSITYGAIGKNGVCPELSGDRRGDVAAKGLRKVEGYIMETAAILRAAISEDVDTDRHADSMPTADAMAKA